MWLLVYVLSQQAAEAVALILKEDTQDKMLVLPEYIDRLFAPAEAGQVGML